MSTCTFGPSAVTGERCGWPAVTRFTAGDGTTLYECATHAVASGRARTGYEPGDPTAVSRTDARTRAR